MPAFGATGQTQTELFNGLELTGVDPLSTVEENMRGTTNVGNSIKLISSNALWPQHGINFNLNFDFIIRNKIKAHFQPLNYKDAVEAANIINQQIEKDTNTRIKNLIDPKLLNDDTKLVLTNAIYFKGDWEHKFNKKSTCDRFFRGLSKTTSVPQMYQREEFGYFEDDKCQAIMLPYKDNVLYNLVILPKEVGSLPKFNMSGEYIHNVLSLAKKEKVNVTMPRYKLESEYKLVPTMKSFGINRAFTDEAELSQITTEEPLKINEIIHKAFVETNEDGTEASAATAVIMARKCSMPMVTDKIKEFICDHPFFTAIYNCQTGTILFAGAVTDI